MTTRVWGQHVVLRPRSGLRELLSGRLWDEVARNFDGTGRPRPICSGGRYSAFDQIGGRRRSMVTAEAEAPQRGMQGRATSRLLSSGEWITAEDIARLGHRSSRNAHALACRWTKKGLIFSIQHEGTRLYPSYALDPAAGYTPKAALHTLITVLPDGDRAGWRLAFWFDSPNSYLNGRRPKHCLDSRLTELLRAARAEAEGVRHG